jgi:serine/threonine protein kinase
MAVCFEILAEGGNAIVCTGSFASPRPDQWHLPETPCTLRTLVPTSVFKVAYGSTVQATKTIQREHFILERFTHNNIVPSLGVYWARCGTADVATLVLPRADACLYDVLQLGVFRDVSRTLARDVLLALDRIHSLSMIHGDVHVRNVLLFGATWKLCDLERAVQIGSDVACMRVGIPYLSRPPEVTQRIHEVEVAWQRGLAGNKALVRSAAALDRLAERPYMSILITATSAMDVWALGSLLYFVYSGTQWMGPIPTIPRVEPGTHSPIEEEVERARCAPIQGRKQLRNIASRHNRVISQVISSCLNEDPRTRPSTAQLLRRIMQRGEGNVPSKVRGAAESRTQTKCTAPGPPVTHFKWCREVEEAVGKSARGRSVASKRPAPQAGEERHSEGKKAKIAPNVAI